MLRPTNTDRLPCGGFDDLPLIRISAQFDHQMEPCGYTLRSKVRQIRPESVHQLIAPGAVDEPGLSEVPSGEIPHRAMHITDSLFFASSSIGLTKPRNLQNKRMT